MRDELVQITKTADHWYKNAIIYCIDVETFLDSNGDGIGDLEGISQRIDYLAEIGVNCIWLMPFYPSPRRDNGYDVSDLYGVAARHGNHGDFVELVRVAHDRGMKLLVDLVINHTSDQHPWFQDALTSTNSRYRDYYVWRDTEPPDTSADAMFPDAEDGVWTHDPGTDQWYMHHFLRSQPDLNTANPAVRSEIAKTMGFWLQLGVDGFRVDAVPFAINKHVEAAVDDHTFDEPHDYLRTLRRFLDRRVTGQGAAVMLGEVNLPHEEQMKFFGGKTGDQLTMQFDFYTNQQLYLALARQDAAPLARALELRPIDLPRTSQYATFLRNHDELTLDLLSEEERNEVLDAFAPEKDMRIFGRGLRRRLPGMFDGDLERLKMVYSLLFALPGTPVLFYGEEIGMGENLAVPGREAVRTPMQWTPGKNGGFSTGDPQNFTRAVTTGRFGPENVNVVGSLRDRNSLLRHIALLARRYREFPELGWGDYTVIQTGVPGVFAHSAEWDGRQMVLLHNLGSEPCDVHFTVPAGEPGEFLVDVFNQEACELGERCEAEVSLGRYGYRWMRVSDHGASQFL